jgi:aminopeptidase N
MIASLVRGTLASAALGPALLAAQVAEPPVRVRPDIGVIQYAPPVEVHSYRPGIDVLDYELAISVPDSGRRISGRAVIALRRTAPVDTLVLDLLRLVVSDVAIDGRSVAFGRDSATIRIPLPAGSRDTLRVAVRYAGEVSDGLVIRTDSSGRWMAFGDNWPDRGRHWIPSVDHPSDKATVTWLVDAPMNRRIVANGELVEETQVPAADGRPGAARTLSRWRESRPIPVYLMVFAAAPLAYHDLGRTACGLSEFDGCVRQSVYAAPDVLDFLPGPFAKAGEIVEFFARLVGPFPYEKLAHVQSSTRFGGMENAGAIFYSDGSFRRRTMGTGLIAHETAHQWFGDAVTEREWSHAWLSEGFATYFAELYVERFDGDSAFRANMREMRGQITSAEVVSRLPVIDTAETDYMKILNTNTYQKGGWTLHMLRTVVGDSAFFRGIRSYYMRHRHSTAMTDDLRRAVERYASTDLRWFFDQWLRRPGYAEITTSWRFVAKSRRLVLQVDQGSRFAPYRFPLTVAIIDRSGRERRVTVNVPAERTTKLTLPLEISAAPREVRVDPDATVLATFTSR